jgi:hypothetical protein
MASTSLGHRVLGHKGREENAAALHFPPSPKKNVTDTERSRGEN